MAAVVAAVAVCLGADPPAPTKAVMAQQWPNGLKGILEGTPCRHHWQGDIDEIAVEVDGVRRGSLMTCAQSVTLVC